MMYPRRCISLAAHIQSLSLAYNLRSCISVNFSRRRVVDFHILLSALHLTMKEHIVEVGRCEFSQRCQIFATHRLNVAGALLKPCGITSKVYILPLGVLTVVRECTVHASWSGRIHPSVIEKIVINETLQMMTPFLGIGVRSGNIAALKWLCSWTKMWSTGGFLHIEGRRAM